MGSVRAEREAREGSLGGYGGDGPDELAVWQRLTEVTGDVLCRNQPPFLVTARAEIATPTGERNEELVAAARAAHARKTLLEVAAGEELLDGPGDDGPPGSSG